VLRERAISAVVLVVGLVVVLALGGPWIAGAVAVITVFAAIEAYSLLRSAGWPSQRLLGLAFALAVVLEAAAPPIVAESGPILGAGSGLLLAAIGVVLAAVGAFSRPDPRDGFATWVGTVFGALYVALLSFVIRLGQAAPELPDDAPVAMIGSERAWILVLILGVWSYDTGAYLVGRTFGRTGFLRHISPSKTLEGVAGGLVASTIITAVMLVLLGQSAQGALVLGPLIGLAAQAGDLAESLLKRAAGAKDSGRLIPGHGGVLDRIDSFLFAAPAVTLYVVAVVR
jgi:phosphatidate cytidylyltransferase